VGSQIPLGGNDFKERALRFSREQITEAPESTNARPFWNGFFDVFGVSVGASPLRAQGRHDGRRHRSAAAGRALMARQDLRAQARVYFHRHTPVVGVCAQKTKTRSTSKPGAWASRMGEPHGADRHARRPAARLRPGM